MTYLTLLKNKALDIARKFSHMSVTIEHLLWIVLDADDPDAIKALNFNPYNEFDKNLSLKNLKQLIDAQHNPEKGMEQTIETMAFTRVLERTETMVKRAERQDATAADLILAIFYEQESPSAKLLKQQHVRREDIESYLAQPRFKTEAQIQKAQEAMQGLNLEALLNPNAKSSEKPLNSNEFLENLNKKYLDGKLPPVIARDAEIAQTVRILAQSRKSNPLLVGEPGVGKTTIAAGLAQLIEQQKVPMVLRNATVYSLKMTALMAGTQYRGEFEKRVNHILDFLKQDQHAILFIDEIHMIIGAGATNGSSSDIANILKPELASGELSCIGATTYKEYRQIFEKDEALKRRFAKVDIPEPTPEQAIEIIQGLQARLEKHHKVSFSHAALETAVRLSKKYIKDRRLPDIALDVLDEAGAMLNMDGSKKTIDQTDIETVIASKANIPKEQIIKSNNNTQFENLDQRLKAKIFGQDHAVDTLVSSVAMAQAGLRDAQKPIGSFLFTGPTGVGKTELCKQLAEELGMKLSRFDMSEYTDQHAYTKLIGTAPGYVGYEQGGQLTEAVNQDPHSIVLLDEIEKAHPQIYNLLLQVLDYGMLTDGQSRKVDFRHTIIVLTTNAGAQALQKRSIGFSEQDNTSDAQQELGRVFTPEFRNRFDEIIQFNPLPKSVAWNVAEKFIKELQKNLSNKNVTITLTDSAKTWFVNHGYDEFMGARPMARLVTNTLKKPLAKELLYGQLKNGGNVLVDCNPDQDSLVFSYQ